MKTLLFSQALIIASWIMVNFTHPFPGKNHLIGTRFPDVQSTSLAGNVVDLPEDLKGKITLITIAFLEEGQPVIDSWAKPFLENYFQKEGFDYYEVPMISDLPQASREFIDSGMRAGIKADMHPNVVTFYGDYSPYLEVLEMKDLRSGYAFLIDQEGIIRYCGEGKMTSENWNKLNAVIKKLKGNK